MPITQPGGGGAAAAETDAAALAALTTHEADTTSIHGIADTAALETTTGSAAKVTTHEADSTAVHGIANTALLVNRSALPLSATVGPTPLYPFVTSATTATANGLSAYRVVVPRTGNLRDLSVFIGVSSGNVEVSVWDTVATTRTALYRSGSVAAGTANNWQTVGDPNLAVTAGDHIDIAVAADNATITLGRIALVNSAVGLLPTAFPVIAPNGGSNRMAWLRTTSFTAPATILESSLALTGSVFFVMWRIS